MPLSRVSVLIVEDQPLIAADLQAAIEEANGNVVGPCASVNEALQLLRLEKIDCAILDSNLPDGDVTPVAEEMIARALPVVIYTGVAGPVGLQRNRPGVQIIRKPAPPWRLIAELGSMLAASTVRS